MDWNALKVFLAIARQGSLAAAAVELGVNHSTVFRRLNAFEDEIGSKLFERISNRYELTSAGNELLKQGEEIEQAFAGIDRHIAGKDIQPRGVVRVTAADNIACRYLPRCIAGFNRLYPEIQIELLVSNQEFNMSNRQADVAVRATPAPAEHLVGKQVATLPWSVYASAQYAADSGLPEDSASLAKHRLIGATAALQRLPAFVWQDKHYARQITARCDDLTAMSYLAEAGQGLALLPLDQQRPELIRLFDLPACPPSQLWLLTHADLRHSERIRLVMQFFAAALAQEWPSPAPPAVAAT